MHKLLSRVLTQASSTCEREAGLRLLARQRRRKLVEQPSSWMKTTGGRHKLRRRGKAKVSAPCTFA